MSDLFALSSAPTEEVIVGGYYAENDGGGGMFVWKAGTAPANDGGTIFGGVLITLTGGWFQRLIPEGIINAKWFGATGDGITNDTDAFQNVSAYINARDGGEVTIPEGTYIVGKQTQATGISDGYAFNPEDIIRISNCVGDVVIKGTGAGAIFKMEDGLYYGSFTPPTTTPYTPSPGGFYDVDYKAQVGIVFLFENNGKVIVKNITVDGNLQNMVIGGYWGDRGYQLSGTGFAFLNNAEVIANTLTSNFNALDGFTVLNTCVNETTPIAYATLQDVNSIGNGRQGLSWVSGNHLFIENGRFNDTGRTVNIGTGLTLTSAPGAGLDIEAEGGNIIRNGYFENCSFINNAGCAMVADSGDSAACTFVSCIFIGTDNVSIWPFKPLFLFDHCTVNGSMVSLYGSIGNPEHATRFIGCDLLMDADQSPTNTVYGVRHDFYYADNCQFDQCNFISTNDLFLPISNDLVIYTNCSFNQSGSDATNPSNTQGIFYGETTINTIGGMDAPSTTIFGRYIMNGTEYPVNYNFLSELTRRQSSDAAVLINFKNWYYHSPSPIGVDSKHDTVINTHYSLDTGSPYGWVCVQSGTPGTWVPFGIIGMVQSAASADSAPNPSAIYSAAEVQDILDELRDLKTQLRAANILLP